MGCSFHNSKTYLAPPKLITMEYNKIISVTGKSGLFELLSTRADGAVVRSVGDNSTKFIASRQHQFSHLESIEVYTRKENVTLREVFVAMKNSEEKVPESNIDAKGLKAYFEKVYSDMDFDRVFNSDLKKMIKWYHILAANNIDFTVESARDTANENGHKPQHTENAHVKEMKPQQANPKKIESRGVK